MSQADSIDPVDLVSVFNDPFLRVRSQADLQKIHHLMTAFHHEFQDMDGALDLMVTLVRDVDADWDSYGDHLRRQARVLDVITGIRTADDIDQARLVAEMSVKIDRLEAGINELRRREDDGGKAVIRRNKVYSRKDAATVLGVSVSTIDREIKRGYLRSIQMGRRVMISGNDLLVYRDAEGDIRVLGD